MITTMKIRAEVMEEAAKSGFMNATDAADYLVSKGLAFRDCHEILGRCALLHRTGKGIEELSLRS
jgi:argininosuccinate lyase